ncbi:nucleotidyltransferase domain-containing protein [Vibrio fluvialis]|uniref:nucleotidyltransferase domain-containing protein n=1 Tax=Vibrio fluvialis TaxID=676 RepID=UPI001C9BE8BC|nr:nucleotidyltransferase domain-containing protein [Vibrio fluvialis]ELV8648737.1 nucleotidyltransferase domain-containing protein [Vibrio fluvialis]MBY7780381.1 nucleotidyltransferase domain-containing protein [Vibrio fluvialis]MBY8089490.1 nucleotidyltransferase domain-containing protein [Vibrio fluvialis]BEI22900.1 nucleotidyltransferase domain-containing protein [Vibrio fluvialis]
MTLPVIDPKQPFQPEYQPAVADLVKFLRAGLGERLHSIYLYGSVARKTAKPGESNLDVVVVTKQPFEDTKATLLNTIRWRFQKSFPLITDVSVKTALVSDVATLDSIFSWGFMLRHCCVCVYGDDLAECFGYYEPSWEIAKHWNQDVGDWLTFYRDKIAKAGSAAEQSAAQKTIAKKLLRASYSLIMYRDKQWLEDPLECGTQFLRYHPEKQLDIDRLAILLSGRVIPKRSVIGLLDSFGPWLVKQYEKTEFRIG